MDGRDDDNGRHGRDRGESPLEAGSAQPLYVQLAQQLADRISRGEHQVGDLLPTEAELGERFGVSRYTVRQAIQHLRQQGLVSARKGVGTRVEAQGSEVGYSQSLQSLSELLQYAHETRLDLTGVAELEARGQLAEQLGCRPRKLWMHVTGVRHGGKPEGPVCLTEVYLDAAYRALVEDTSTLRTAFWSLIEKQFGETIVEVEQQIDAVLLEEEQAQQLDSKVGAPGLLFTRRYFVTGRRLVELARNLHPADRFSYKMSIRRDLG